MGLIPKMVLTTAVSEDKPTIFDHTADMGNGAANTYGSNTKDRNRHKGGHGKTDAIRTTEALLNAGALSTTDKPHGDNL